MQNSLINCVLSQHVATAVEFLANEELLDAGCSVGLVHHIL